MQQTLQKGCIKCKCKAGVCAFQNTLAVLAKQQISGDWYSLVRSVGFFPCSTCT